MAVFNEILVGRFARSVQKLFGVKAQPPVNALSSDVMAVHPYQSGAENRYLEGWQLYAYASRQFGGAGAGNTIGYRFRNPVGSNVIAIVTSIIMATSVANDEVFVSHGHNILDMITIENPVGAGLDERGQANPTLVISHASGGNVPPTILAFMMDVNVPSAGTNSFIFYAGQEIPLTPGHALQIQNNVIGAATFLGVSLMWRERFLEDSERT